MSLNLKSEETHKLAHELAALTGESMTAAVTIAVRERLERIRREREIDRLVAETMAIAHDFAKGRKGRRLPDPNNFLYDENGMPK
jgi:antitoxin VapB